MTDIEAFVAGLVAGMINRYHDEEENGLQVVDMNTETGVMKVMFEDVQLNVHIKEDLTEEDLPIQS